MQGSIKADTMLKSAARALSRDLSSTRPSEYALQSGYGSFAGYETHDVSALEHRIAGGHDYGAALEGEAHEDALGQG
jgi:hypothetical protein